MKMKKNILKWGMPVLVLAFAVSVIGARSKVPAFEVIEPIMPDENSAVVYFIGWKNMGDVWDGEKPIGTFNGKTPLYPIIAYKTTPGSHYFLANASNWLAMRADLEPNKRYFVRILPAPISPPFTQFIIMHIWGTDDGEAYVNKTTKQRKILSYTDAWRAEFAQGKRLKEAQENFQDAQGRLTEVDLSGEHGI